MVCRSDPIIQCVLLYPHPQNVTVTQTRCVSYDFDVFRWTTEGCTTEVNDDVITCTCNHLTNFAALVVCTINGKIDMCLGLLEY